MNIDDIIQKLTDESAHYVYIIPKNKINRRISKNSYIIKNVISNYEIELILDDNRMIISEGKNISNELKELIKKINLHMILLE